ncbi:MAG: hypothetical protein HN576_05065 [Bacteriovoracaceae bacterium]|nr:hypothetical protein [Bacteriovoracaceae bacterium]
MKLYKSKFSLNRLIPIGLLFLLISCNDGGAGGPVGIIDGINPPDTPIVEGDLTGDEIIDIIESEISNEVIADDSGNSSVNGPDSNVKFCLPKADYDKEDIDLIACEKSYNRHHRKQFLLFCHKKKVHRVKLKHFNKLKVQRKIFTRAHTHLLNCEDVEQAASYDILKGVTKKLLKKNFICGCAFAGNL